MMETVTISKDPPPRRKKNHHNDGAGDDGALDLVRDVVRRMEGLGKTYQRPVSLPSPFNGIWREQIIRWMYAIVNYCKLSHEAVAAASYYLDCSCVKGLVETPHEYQLAAMSSLYLALKVFDSPAQRIIKLESLIKLGTGRFGEEDIVSMELQIISALQWRLHPPTIACFFQQYKSVLRPLVSKKTMKSVDRESLSIIELLVSRESFLATEPSTLAFATILVAIEKSEDIDMTISQLNSFLNQMSNISSLDGSSACLNQASQDISYALLESSSSLCPTDAEDSSTSQTHSKNEKQSLVNQPRSPSRSPTHVISRYF